MKKVFILAEHLNDEHEVDFYEEGYTHLRAFHACRPLRISDYLNNGITPISYKSALKDTKDRVVCDYISKEDAISEFKKEWSKFDDIHKRVWLQIDKDELLGMSSHYLIYGSEFINALAMNLGCRSRLKEIGIPTIFYCDIPIRDVAQKDIDEIQERINNRNVNNIGIAVDNVLPQNIVNYEHPIKRLTDPYGGTYKPDYEKLNENAFIFKKI